MARHCHRGKRHATTAGSGIISPDISRLKKDAPGVTAAGLSPPLFWNSKLLPIADSDWPHAH
jgi:hypothetical protein